MNNQDTIDQTSYGEAGKKMTSAERQFLMTVVWLFMRHGQRERALAVCEAIVEENPHDGVAAVALAELLLNSGNASRAVDVLRLADVPTELEHAAAFLETRALRKDGRDREATRRWNRYLEARKGADRRWV